MAFAFGLNEFLASGYLATLLPAPPTHSLLIFYLGVNSLLNALYQSRLHVLLILEIFKERPLQASMSPHLECTSLTQSILQCIMFTMTYSKAAFPKV